MTFSETPASRFALSLEESNGGGEQTRLHIAALAAGDIMRPNQPSLVIGWTRLLQIPRPALCGNASHVLALFVCASRARPADGRACVRARSGGKLCQPVGSDN